MATAIDFQALFAEERARMLVELGEVGTGTAPAVDEPASRGPASPRWEQLPWEALPDPPVALAPKTPLNIEANALCRTALAGVHYVPNFVTPDEAAALLARLEEMPESCWAQLRRRRLQNHGGTPHANGMHPEPIPRFVQALMDATVEAGVFPRDAPPNHVLLNEYARGQGIAPHQDGPLYAPQVPSRPRSNLTPSIAPAPAPSPASASALARSPATALTPPHPVAGQVAILSVDGPALLQFWPSLEVCARTSTRTNLHRNRSVPAAARASSARGARGGRRRHGRRTARQALCCACRTRCLSSTATRTRPTGTGSARSSPTPSRTTRATRRRSGSRRASSSRAGRGASRSPSAAC